MKEYYQTANLYLPDKPQWRFFIFKFKDKTVKRFHIKDKDELRKLLLKYLPYQVYFSSGAWLNVQNVRGKTKTTSYPIKIFGDLIFDIDSKNFQDAKQSVFEVIKRIGEPDRIVKTNRGYHIWYLKRQHKKGLIECVRDIKDLDIHATENEFNVFALPKTLKKGNICNFITLNDLYLDRDTSERLNANETAEHSANTRSELDKKETEPEGTVLSFNNKVKSNIFIPILLYDKKLNGLKKEIDYLCKQYDLGNLYVFENDISLCFISLKCMDEKQLMKLLNSSRCISKLQFKKFKKVWFNYSEFKPSVLLKFNHNKYLRISKKHKQVLEKFGFKINQGDEEVGSNDLRLYEVSMK